MSDPAKPLDAWRDVLIEAHDAASTIAMRALAIQRAFIAGDFSSGVEAQRVVTEKLFLAQQDFLNAAMAAAGSGPVSEAPPQETAPAPVVKKAAKKLAKRTKAMPKATKKAALKSKRADKNAKTRRPTAAKRK